MPSLQQYITSFTAMISMTQAFRQNSTLVSCFQVAQAGPTTVSELTAWAEPAVKVLLLNFFGSVSCCPHLTGCLLCLAKDVHSRYSAVYSRE